MAEETKITEQELKEIQDLQTEYGKKTAELGKLAVLRLNLNQDLKKISTEEMKVEEEYLTLQKKEADLLKKLNEKYGTGSLDLNTGVLKK